VIDVREVYLDAALGAAVAEFGSISRYLEVAAGLDAGRRDLLRAALLE
jgi:protein tyrosine/serine phosphatase